MGRRRDYNLYMELTPLILSGFKKVNDKTAPDLIANDEATILQDVVLDYKLYKPVKRGHWSRYDAGVSAGYDIDTLNDIDLDGTPYLLAAIESDPGVSSEVDIYDISANTWTGYISALTAGAKFKMIPFAESYIFCFDTNDVPKQVDKTTSAVTSLELTIPVATAIQSYHVNGGNLEQNALYKWLIVGVTEDGQYSPPSRPFTHIHAAGTYQTTDDDTLSTKIYFKNLPYIADARVVSRYIYRTKADNNIGLSATPVKTGELYYLATILDNDSTGTSYQTEFTDNIPDNELGTEIAVYLNMPTRAEHITFSQERLFFGNFSQTNRNYISPPSTQTGGTPPAGYTDGVELDVVDTASGGALLNETLYTYRIHYVDKFGRLSRYYHEIAKETSAAGSNDHSLEIRHIGGIDNETAKEYPQVEIFRQTAGAGSYYSLGRYDIVGYPNPFSTLQIGVGASSIEDFGIADTATIWVDPEAAANIKNYASAIAFSEISSPSSFRDEDKKQIFFDDGAEVTGIFDDQEGVVVFKTNSIYKIYISGAPENWRLVELVKKYGCDQPYTLQKSGGSFYFIYGKKAYRYDYGAEKPVDIGFYFQDTLDSIDTWYDSTINDEWYMIQCSVSGVYYTLVYDMKLETWYKWKHTQGAAEVFERLHIIKYGTDKGKILGSADSYVTVYNPLTSTSNASRVDTEIGSNQQIIPWIVTKTFKSDGISLLRLRDLKFDYYKMVGQNATITITDKDTAVNNTFTDSTSSGIKLYEIGIGKATDTLKQSRSFNLFITGAGMVEWDNLRIDGRSIRKGKQVGT